MSGQGAKQALEEAFETGDPIEAIVERRGLAQVSDAGALGAIVDEVLAEHPDVVAQFRGGKEGVIGFLVGSGHEALRRLRQPEARAGAAARAPVGLTGGRARARRAGAAEARPHLAARPAGPRARPGQGLVFPLRRMWRSKDPLDTYGLCHMASVAGDTLLAIALADSVFFSIPVGQAKFAWRPTCSSRCCRWRWPGPSSCRCSTARVRDVRSRSAPRPAAAAAAILAAPRFGTWEIFPWALILLVLSKVHAITKNGLTMAYAPQQEGLMRANARLGRIAVAGALAVVAVRLRLPEDLGRARERCTSPRSCTRCRPRSTCACPTRATRALSDRGRSVRVGASRSSPCPSIGAVGMRAASGFLLFLLAFSLRAGHAPTYWFAVLAFGGVAGGFLADLVAPRLPTATREEAVVIACLSAACIGAVLAFEIFGLPLLTVFALVAGAAGEFGRLAFQSLMQRHAPAGRDGPGVRPLRGAVPGGVGGGRVPAGHPADRLPIGDPDPRRLLRPPRRRLGLPAAPGPPSLGEGLSPASPVS